eukprot:1987814-Prymnesium_polylepis.1
MPTSCGGGLSPSPNPPPQHGAIQYGIQPYQAWDVAQLGAPFPVDVLNRCTGPAADNLGESDAEFTTAFQLLTGDKSKVMGILPFGCRAFAVKPRENFSKTRLDARAWVGINLGRSALTPGAYEVYIPSLKK